MWEAFCRHSSKLEVGGGGGREGPGRSLQAHGGACHRLTGEHIICFLEPHFHYEGVGRVGEQYKNTFSLTSQGCHEGISKTANIWKVVGFFSFFMQFPLKFM